MNRKSVTIINLLLIAVLCVSITSCERGKKAVMPVVSPPADILLTLTHNDANSLIPVNGIDQWDGWLAGVWEQYPDGTQTEKPRAYYNFPEMDEWDHWIYVHATSIIKYDISEIEPARFGAYFATTHATCVGGLVKIFIYSDQEIIYESEELRRNKNGMYIEVNIPEGTETLTIAVDKLRSTFCDHVVFGEPTLFAGTSTTTK